MVAANSWQVPGDAPGAFPRRSLRGGCRRQHEPALGLPGRLEGQVRGSPFERESNVWGRRTSFRHRPSAPRVTGWPPRRRRAGSPPLNTYQLCRAAQIITCSPGAKLNRRRVPGDAPQSTRPARRVMPVIDSQLVGKPLPPTVLAAVDGLGRRLPSNSRDRDCEVVQHKPECALATIHTRGITNPRLFCTCGLDALRAGRQCDLPRPETAPDVAARSIAERIRDLAAAGSPVVLNALRTPR